MLFHSELLLAAAILCTIAKPSNALVLPRSLNQDVKSPHPQDDHRENANELQRRSPMWNLPIRTNNNGRIARTSNDDQEGAEGSVRRGNVAGAAKLRQRNSQSNELKSALAKSTGASEIPSLDELHARNVQIFGVGKGKKLKEEEPDFPQKEYVKQVFENTNFQKGFYRLQTKSGNTKTPFVDLWVNPTSKPPVIVSRDSDSLMNLAASEADQPGSADSAELGLLRAIFTRTRGNWNPADLDGALYIVGEVGMFSGSSNKGEANVKRVLNKGLRLWRERGVETHDDAVSIIIPSGRFPEEFSRLSDTPGTRRAFKMFAKFANALRLDVDAMWPFVDDERGSPAVVLRLKYAPKDQNAGSAAEGSGHQN